MILCVLLIRILTDVLRRKIYLNDKTDIFFQRVQMQMNFDRYFILSGDKCKINFKNFKG